MVLEVATQEVQVGLRQQVMEPMVVVQQGLTVVQITVVQLMTVMVVLVALIIILLAVAVAVAACLAAEAEAVQVAVAPAVAAAEAARVLRVAPELLAQPGALLLPVIQVIQIGRVPPMVVREVRLPLMAQLVMLAE